MLLENQLLNGFQTDFHLSDISPVEAVQAIRSDDAGLQAFDLIQCHFVLVLVVLPSECFFKDPLGTYPFSKYTVNELVIGVGVLVARCMEVVVNVANLALLLYSVAYFGVLDQALEHIRELAFRAALLIPQQIDAQNSAFVLLGVRFRFACVLFKNAVLVNYFVEVLLKAVHMSRYVLLLIYFDFLLLSSLSDLSPVERTTPSDLTI
jgi:hypothetical protein